MVGFDQMADAAAHATWYLTMKANPLAGEPTLTLPKRAGGGSSATARGQAAAAKQRKARKAKRLSGKRSVVLTHRGHERLAR